MPQNRTILIVDNDPVEAQNLEFVVQSLGFGAAILPSSGNDVVNFAMSGNINAAIIDIMSGEQVAFPVARILKQRLIPFFFTAARSRDVPRSADFEEVTLTKPLERAVIEKLLLYMLARPKMPDQ